MCVQAGFFFSRANCAMINANCLMSSSDVFSFYAYDIRKRVVHNVKRFAYIVYTNCLFQYINITTFLSFSELWVNLCRIPKRLPEIDRRRTGVSIARYVLRRPENCISFLLPSVLSVHTHPSYMGMLITVLAIGFYNTDNCNFYYQIINAIYKCCNKRLKLFCLKIDLILPFNDFCHILTLAPTHYCDSPGFSLAF